MLAHGGSFVVFRAGTEAVLRDALHLVEEMVAQFKEAMLLAVKKTRGSSRPSACEPGAAGASCSSSLPLAMVLVLTAFSEILGEAL